MTTARVVKIKYADAPREGRKLPTVKTADGEVFGVLQKLFGLVQPGNSYRIEWTEREYQGRTYRTITRCELAEAPAAAAPSNNNPAPAPVSHATEAAFVARLLAAEIAACTVGHAEAELVAEARRLRNVYRAVFGA